MLNLQNKTMNNILLILGIFCVIDTILLIILNIPIHLGIVIPGILGICLIIFVFLRSKIRIFENKYLVIFLKISLIVFIISFAIIQCIIFLNTNQQFDNDVKYVIVLGGGLVKDKFTPTMQNRVDKALELLKKDKKLKVIVSGGRGFGDTLSEGEVLGKYLVDNNIEKDRILVENKATSTMENFKFSRQILDDTNQKETKKIYVVTSGFHLFRAKMIAKRNDFIPYGIPAKSQMLILPNNLIREYFAIIKSFLFDI